MAKKDTVRIGVIGVGYVAKNNFLPVLPQFDDVEFVGLMARNVENAKRAQRMCGAQHVVGTIEELVDLGLDAAFVLTPKRATRSRSPSCSTPGWMCIARSPWPPPSPTRLKSRSCRKRRAAS